MIAELERETFASSRLLDFFTSDGLSAETGHGAAWWPEMIVAELADNAMDATEGRGIPPRVDITVTDRSIRVADNGPGIPPETVKGACDYSVRVSDKSCYVSPTRGSMGNALMTVVAAPYVASGSEGIVHFDSGGKRYTAIITVDAIREEPRVELTNGEPTGGKSAVTVEWPEDLSDGSFQFLEVAEGIAFLNPHATVSIDAPQGAIEYERTNPGWKKWIPTFSTSVYWYSAEDLGRLIASCLRKDAKAGESRTLRDFLSSFDGLRSSPKQKQVLDSLGLKGEKLSTLAVGDDLDREAIERLLEAMKENTRPVRPERLGTIGEDHLRQRMANCGASMETFNYKRKVGVQGGLPYVIEAAFAYAPGQTRRVVSGVNWSPAYDRLAFYDVGDDWELEGYLQDRRCGRGEPIILVLHLAIPKVHWTDRGKTAVDLTGQIAEDFRKTLTAVTKEWHRIRKAEERNAKLIAQRMERMSSRKRREEMSLVDAVSLEIENAIHITSGGGEFVFPGRNLFYTTRRLIQKHTKRKLSQNRFDQIIKEWQAEHGLIDLMYRDPRGYLIEPHTGRTVPLGTREVDSYEISPFLFHTVLYIEKKGFADLLAKSKLAERFDIAIAAAEGYAVDAAKMLLEKAQEAEMTLLCLHDADPHGKNIWRRLRDKTLRSGNIEVVDFGMTLDEGLEMGLEPEKFTRDEDLAHGLDEFLTALELEAFTGRPTGETSRRRNRPEFECERVELNDLASEPNRFIAYVERKLQKHGVDRKLVPPVDVVEDSAEQQRDAILSEHIRESVEQQLNLGELVDRVTSRIGKHVAVGEIPRLVEEWADDPQPERWTDFIGRELRSQIGQQADRIAAEVARELNIEE